mmetsp:Transcript_55587/g.98582  ORF Transcript_55587/g.98582 Transcript_55587/m.98582 type:complete len:213 (-) Transcript_55587:183-821(-)
MPCPVYCPVSNMLECDGKRERDYRVRCKSVPASHFMPKSITLFLDDGEEARASTRCPSSTRSPSSKVIRLERKSVSHLRDLVAKSMACYGIEWVHCDDGFLKCRVHYNPPWRLAEVSAQGSASLYTTGSECYSFLPGEGLVGKTFVDQKPLFVTDFESVDPDAVVDATSGESMNFLRAGLAKKHGIRSVIFLPLPESVIEIGAKHAFLDVFF